MSSPNSMLMSYQNSTLNCQKRVLGAIFGELESRIRGNLSYICMKFSKKKTSSQAKPQHGKEI